MGEILLVDKPKALTSFQAVEQIKRKFKVKAGHAGTLGPLATGLLIVLTGKRSKEASRFLKLNKTYEVKAILGMGIDTFDMKGKVLRQSQKKVTREELEEVLKEFHGEIWQTPSSFSAKKNKRSKSLSTSQERGEGRDTISKGKYLFFRAHRISVSPF